MHTYVWTVGHETLRVAHHDVWWMSWNLLLAAVPAALAILLFHRAHRQTMLWWAGVATFVLFLPNAPYVLTDLIHMRANARFATLHGTVLFGILPIYAVFVLAGFSCYAIALHEVGRAVARSSWSGWTGRVQLGLHALCAIGVLLGRVPHINSWSVVTHPRLSASLSVHTLTNPAAPLVLAALFVAIWLGHASMQTMAETVRRLWTDQFGRGRGHASPIG
jgi:uncharacterized membrane protein